MRKKNGLTAAQQAAHEAAYAACDHTVEGRFAKGDLVSDYQGNAWKVMTYGIRYHEDVSSRLYGVQFAHGPKGWPETRLLRQTIKQIRRTGTQERPAGAAIARWQDSRPDSTATYPELTIYEGGVIGVWCPVYDDSPVVAWSRDVKLAARLQKAIATCPQPVHLPETGVRERTTRLEIALDHPNYAAYAAARDARPFEAVAWRGVGPDTPGGIELPRSEYRRIKSEREKVLD